METIITLIENNALTSTIIAAIMAIVFAYFAMVKVDSNVTKITLFCAVAAIMFGYTSAFFCEILFGDYVPQSINLGNQFFVLLGFACIFLTVAGMVLFYPVALTGMVIYYCVRSVTRPFVSLYKKSTLNTVA